MRWGNIIFIVFVCVLTILLSSLVLGATISSCTTINSSGSYSLITDLSSSSNCLIINSNHVSILGDGYKIVGNGISSGIFFNYTRNTSLDDVHVRNFSIGISINHSTHLTISNSILNATSKSAFSNNLSHSLFNNNTFPVSSSLYFNSNINVTLNSSLQYPIIDVIQSNVTFQKLLFGNENTTIRYDNLQSNNQLIDSSKDIFVNSNYVDVSSSNSLGLNRLATITLQLMGYVSNSRYSIFKDGVFCSNCTKKNFNPVMFDVISFSNYTTHSNSVPLVYDIYPSNGSNFDQDTNIEVAFNVTDPDNDSITFSNATIYYPNGTIVPIILSNSIGDRFNTSFLLPSLGGLFIIEFYTNDSNGNQNLTESTQFIVTGGIDFIVKSVNQTTLNPVEDDPLSFDALIENNGSAGVNLVNVTLYRDNVHINSTLINLSAFSNQMVTFTSVAKMGYYNYSIIVDPSNVSNEIYESNNQNEILSGVNGYTLFYGFVSADFKIGETGSTLVTFFNGTVLNVFVVEGSSSVDFSSLQAVGKNIYGNSALNDFSEVDQGLGMVSFSDSILNVYAINNDTARNSSTFSIFGTSIINIPTQNNSNISQFSTGILWDMSDDNNTEYDSTEKEDLVFVSNVNVSGVATYGNFDYEVRVPSLLREYSGVGDTVDFYIELG